MIKNEEQRLEITLNSCKNIIKHLIIYDTGSTDNSIDIVTTYSKKHNIQLSLKNGIFSNFESSRNDLLTFADTINNIDYYLLLDVNDEVKNQDKLFALAQNELLTTTSGYLLLQQWQSSILTSYSNIKFIKSKSGWKYKGEVHEYLYNIHTTTPNVVKQNDIIVYQNRMYDNEKSQTRFTTDLSLLLNTYQNDSSDTRTTFYLAQTYVCLNDYENAFFYYKIRSIQDGFNEEKFHALLNCGNIGKKLNLKWDDIFIYYMTAFKLIKRVEPLIQITKYYIELKEWLLASTFISLACKLQYPSHCILYINEYDYSYVRWHLKSIVSYHLGKYNKGKIACIKAINSGINTKLEISNLATFDNKLNM